ncbi:SERTA domain-containing protein 2-like [Pempheris klunzingeri]|uniref:SERTA domain-containing protein 2-like n=1 Tax=Pempheris klunzingeri TaxID=3127111 RepID=UPI00397EF738
MLANGVKRKLDEDEDVLEEERRPLAAGGGPSQASYTLRRQTVLNVSLMKLYGPRMGVDLGLRRRVLINNIIRRIHEDFRREGGVGALFFSAAPPVAAAAGEDAGYRQAPPPPSSFSILSSPLSGLSALDSCLTPASLLEEDLPMFFTLPPSSSSQHHQHHHHSLRTPPTPPKDSFSSALEEIEELCPSSSSSSSSGPPPPPPTRVVFDVVMKEEGRGLQENRLEKPPPPPLPAPPPPPSPSSSGSFLTDFALDDVLFTDIDTSMYDLGPCPPPPPGAPPSKVAPVVMADDLVRSMSGFGAAGAGAQNQPFKMDLAELDHIMEVLVGS